LNQAVKSVSWDKSGVTVECRSTVGASALRVRGARAIVTLPLGVLASRAVSADAVRFEPALDAKTRAMSKLAMGNVVRQVLRFDQAFWEERSVVRARKGEPLEQLSFLHADDQDFPTSWTQFPVHAPLLTLWAGGSKADALGTLGDEEIVARALASLARALGVPASVPRAHLVEGWRHDWAADPFARGAYSHPLAGGMQAARALAAPVEGTLFFAGEATSNAPDNGTLDGAIASGRRAAREVMRLIAR
jgi:monoamine oxidase